MFWKSYMYWKIPNWSVIFFLEKPVAISLTMFKHPKTVLGSVMLGWFPSDMAFMNWTVNSDTFVFVRRQSLIIIFDTFSRAAHHSCCGDLRQQNYKVTSLQNVTKLRARSRKQTANQENGNAKLRHACRNQDLGVSNFALAWLAWIYCSTNPDADCSSSDI